MNFQLILVFAAALVPLLAQGKSFTDKHAPVGPIPPTRPNAYCAQLPSQYPFSKDELKGQWKLNRVYTQYDDESESGIRSDCGKLIVSDNIISDDLQDFSVSKKGPNGVGTVAINRMARKGDPTQPGRWILEESGIFQTIKGPMVKTSLIFMGVTLNESVGSGYYDTLLYAACGMLPDGSAGSWSISEIGILVRDGANMTDVALNHYDRLLTENSLRGVADLTLVLHEECQ